MSKRTLLNRLKQYGLTRRNCDINEAVLRTLAQNSKELETYLATEQCGENYI